MCHTYITQHNSADGPAIDKLVENQSAAGKHACHMCDAQYVAGAGRHHDWLITKEDTFKYNTEKQCWCRKCYKPKLFQIRAWLKAYNDSITAAALFSNHPGVQNTRVRTKKLFDPPNDVCILSKLRRQHANEVASGK